MNIKTNGCFKFCQNRQINFQNNEFLGIAFRVALANSFKVAVQCFLMQVVMNKCYS